VTAGPLAAAFARAAAYERSQVPITEAEAEAEKAIGRISAWRGAIVAAGIACRDAATALSALLPAAPIIADDGTIVGRGWVLPGGLTLLLDDASLVSGTTGGMLGSRIAPPIRFEQSVYLVRQNAMLASDGSIAMAGRYVLKESSGARSQQETGDQEVVIILWRTGHVGVPVSSQFDSPVRVVEYDTGREMRYFAPIDDLLVAALTSYRRDASIALGPHRLAPAR
jgi:hypothetical protein